MNQIAKHIIFKGRVQGVGFRFTSANIARRNNINGFVKNLPNGSVELLAQGQSSKVLSTISQIQSAFEGYISNINETDTTPNTSITTFRIEY